MVPLPLFKLAALFVRHVSKYGANRIKVQAHEHEGFRKFAARYGQMIHQLNMRLSVALLRNVEAEMRAKDKAESPTVKTKEETEKALQKEEIHKARSEKSKRILPPASVWRRRFRPLSDSKAVDLFADVVGDGFILLVATGLIFYEYHRSSQKPDANLEKIKELNKQLAEFKVKDEERTEDERRRESRILAMENALRSYRDPKTKQPLLPTPTAVA